MRKGKVYVKGILAGIIQEDAEGFLFVYEDSYMTDRNNLSVSLTIPKTIKTHRSKHLFPFFFNMLSEGSNRSVQLRTLKIDENDYFGLLLATAYNDTIGAVTVVRI